MRRAAGLLVVLCGLTFVVSLCGCGGMTGTAGSVQTAGRTPKPCYYATELPVPPGYIGATPWAVSDIGTADGQSVVWVGGVAGNGTFSNGVVWKVVLPSTPAGQPVVTTINLGDQVGSVVDINQYGRGIAGDRLNNGLAYYWDNGTLTPLPGAEGWPNSFVIHIGRDATTVRIAGQQRLTDANGQYQYRAALWEFPAGSPAAPRTLPDLNGAAANYASGFQENASGLRILVSYSTWFLGTLRQNGTFTDTTDLGVGVSCGDVNSAGQVVCNKLKLGTWQPYLWQNGVLTLLPSLQGYHDTVAGALNNAGVVVGTASTSLLPQRAVRWQAGKVEDLNTLVDPGVAGTLAQVIQRSSINNSGYIVAQCKASPTPAEPYLHGPARAYLLRPK